jgi:electron transport complex protein RnfB
VSGPAAGTSSDDADARKRAIIQAALERARQKKQELAAKGTGPQNTERVSADVQAQIDAAEARRRRLGIEAAEPAQAAPADEAPITPRAPKP